MTGDGETHKEKTMYESKSLTQVIDGVTVEFRVNGLYLSVVTDTGNYYSRLYIDYTTSEAVESFNEYVKEEEKKIIREVR